MSPSSKRIKDDFNPLEMMYQILWNRYQKEVDNTSKDTQTIIQLTEENLKLKQIVNGLKQLIVDVNLSDIK